MTLPLTGLLKPVPTDRPSGVIGSWGLTGVVTQKGSTKLEGQARSLPELGFALVSEPATMIEIPFRMYPSEESLEEAVALAIVASTGARQTHVTSWQHLPDHWGSLLLTRPAIGLCHPATLRAMMDGFQVIRGHYPMRGYMDCPIVESAYIPEGFLVVGDRSVSEHGSMGMLFCGRDVPPPRVLDGFSRHQLGYRAHPLLQRGIAINATGLAAAVFQKPAPKPRVSWDRVLEDYLG